MMDGCGLKVKKMVRSLILKNSSRAYASKNSDAENANGQRDESKVMR
jgi:hypothetical protein